MENAKGFFDYCISETCATSDTFNKFINVIYKLGYRTIAINQIVDESTLNKPTKNKKSKVDNEIVPSPIKPVYDSMGVEYKDLKILNRLTIMFSLNETIHSVMKCSNVKKYHILALLPTSQKACTFALSDVSFDILCFNPETRVPYKFSRCMYVNAVKKNIYFEILYAPAIIDQSKRVNTIRTSHVYHAIGKSKNIIISSGASNLLQIRGPYDVTNLGIIFGLSSAQAKQAITDNGRNVFIHSVGRRLGNAVIIPECVQSSDLMAEIEEQGSSDEEMELDVDQPAQKKLKQ